MRYRGHLPALDGLRGLAVLSVLWFHCLWSQDALAEPTRLDTVYQRLRGAGWMGVDLFFVLSGFLITGILLDADKRNYFRRFYRRRTLRIFPLYYAFLLGVVLLAWLYPSPNSTRLMGVQPWLWSYATNVLVALQGTLAIQSVNHLWSLAVEEQFYLVWPLVVRWTTAKRVAQVCLLLIAVALVARLAVDTRPVTRYMLTPFRMDALAMGGLLAALLRMEWSLRAWPFLATGAVILAWVGLKLRVLSWIPELMQGFGYTGSALLAAGLLLLALRRGWFEWRWLRFLGKYSYGIYLLHFPLIDWFTDVVQAWGPPPRLLRSQIPAEIAFTLFALSLSTGAALLSWVLIEQPFLKLKERRARAHAVAAGAPLNLRVDSRPPPWASEPPSQPLS